MKRNRILLIGSLILMAAAMALPLWRIEIFAPQYPEGLYMQIGISDISGNIQQINILNHYIGMKPIVPAEIPELGIAPSALGLLIALGLLAAWANRAWVTRSWLLLLCSSGAIGLIDMYLWGYDYGHNLNPDAPIKIPGMSYQPPLIGHKTLLNIDSYSLPGPGGYLFAAAIALAFLAAFGEILSQRMRQYFPKEGK
jgi:copper chaperone NosL